MQPSINGNLWPQGRTPKRRKKREEAKQLTIVVVRELRLRLNNKQQIKQILREYRNKKNKRKYFRWREMECALICINYVSGQRKDERIEGRKDAG